MAKSGIILGVIALLLGASGLGFGVFLLIDQNRTDFWYDYKPELFTPTAIEFVTVPELYLIISLDTAATVHIIFTTSTRILPDPLSFADMIFYFWIDGERLTNPFTRAGPFEGDATYQYVPVTLQHSQILSAGVHNISIVVFSETAGNLIRESALAVNRY